MRSPSGDPLSGRPLLPNAYDKLPAAWRDLNPKPTSWPPVSFIG
jgi:hypothetical protein